MFKLDLKNPWDLKNVPPKADQNSMTGSMLDTISKRSFSGDSSLKCSVSNDVLYKENPYGETV